MGVVVQVGKDRGRSRSPEKKRLALEN